MAQQRKKGTLEELFDEYERSPDSFGVHKSMMHAYMEEPLFKTLSRQHPELEAEKVRILGGGTQPYSPHSLLLNRENSKLL
jgi:hypothetical protein